MPGATSLFIAALSSAAPRVCAPSAHTTLGTSPAPVARIVDSMSRTYDGVTLAFESEISSKS